MASVRNGSVPWPLWALAALALASVLAPLIALLGRVRWDGFLAQLTSPAALRALALSFGTAACSTALCLLLGVPLAALIARAGHRTAALLRALVMVPLLMPPLVGGLALLALWGRSGALGGALDATFDVQLPFSTAAVILAQTFVALPFLVIATEQALRGIDPRLPAVARSLGASPARAWWRVTVPLAAPAIIAGATLAFARSLAEFGATAVFAGNRDGVTRTAPLAIYTAFNGDVAAVESAYALAVVLLVAAVLVLIALRGWRAGGTR